MRTIPSLLLLLLLGCSEAGSPRLLEGGRLNLQTEEQLLIINYWAAWCAPCIAEMPELHAFATAYPDRARVLGVNYDNLEAERLHEDAELLNVQIELLLDDPQPQLGYARPEVLPTTLLVRGGVVLETLVGPQTLESLEERLQWWTTNS